MSMMRGAATLSPDSALASDIFDHYCAAQTFKGILSHYRRLCGTLNLKPGKFPVFYPKLKSKLKSWKAQGLFGKFDKRASHKCYNQGRACANTKVLVIGCGPCGLRAAIEAQLLGARVVVLEKRDRFSRNNVLHLWPMVIHDLKALGAKKFFGKFCAGAIDHISIRQLQCILLKVALLLGVEVYENVGYEELLEPPDDQTGWRARLSPVDHQAAQFQFDVLVGADGKRNTFKCFRRKEFRGKLAIAITANFVNRHTEAEARVDEISGVAFIFNQKFFKDLFDATGIELENIVYYKDETHYFVMTAKKQSLLAKGVIIQDFMDTNRLLSPENVNRQKLMQYAREAANFSTEHRLPPLPFALNHYGREDVAMFDFTCMYASQNAGKVMERRGHRLLLQLVGDSLLEPFWPTGSGCARGFLSCFDAAWQMRGWADPRVTMLECLAEREAIYRQLAQTTPRNLSCEYHGYTLDPRTRYPNLNRSSVSPYQVRDLVDTDCPESIQEELTAAAAAGDADRAVHSLDKKACKEPLQSDMLLKWCQKQLALTDIQITDLTLSFKSGLALCGILHNYRPDLVDLASLSADQPLTNTQLAFSLVESELGVPPVMTAQQMVDCVCPDRLAMLSYLSQVFAALHGEIPYVKPKIAELLREEAVDSGVGRSAAGSRFQADGRRSSFTENSRKQRKRKSDAAKDKGRVIQDLRKDLTPAEPFPTKREEFATKIKDLEAKFKEHYVPPAKKPKDLSRAIGRIEKTDWNLREIERKIEDSKKVHTSREPAQAVPMWSKDMFDDKYQAMRNLSERGASAVPPETLRKYADIDQHLRRLELKLREGTTRDVGQRGSNRVSQMAQQFLDRADRAPSTDKNADAGAAEACHFCNERVYLVERMSAEARFFHHGCFRCEYCGTVLKMMNYAFDQDSGRFFCMPHFGLHSLVKYKYQRKPDQLSDAPDKGGLSVAAAAAARGATPERAEFENSVLPAALEDGRLSEMDEDEWTDHNFGISATEVTSEDLIDGDDDDDDLSSDSEPYDQPLDEDDVLRLAERWRRRHSQDPLDQPSDLYESDGCDGDGDDSDTATQSETEDDASARFRRQQEVRLAEDVLKSRNRSSKHDDTSNTETSSDSDSSSSEETTSSEDEDATEVATDSEFDEAPSPAARLLPTIVIENSAVSETPEPDWPRPGRRPEPIGAEQGCSEAIPVGACPAEPAQKAAVPAAPAATRTHGGRQRDAAEQAATITNVNARPHTASAKMPDSTAKTRRSMTEEEGDEDSVARIIREAHKIAPLHRPYLVQRTESSEALAWKSSLELKRKYLTEQTAAYVPCKSQSTTDLDSRVRTFISRISETQKLLGAGPPTASALRPSSTVRLTLDLPLTSLSSRLATTGSTSLAQATTKSTASVLAAKTPSSTLTRTSALMRTVSASSAVQVTATAPAPGASSRPSPVAAPLPVPPACPPPSPVSSPPPMPELPPPETAETGYSTGETGVKASLTASSAFPSVAPGAPSAGSVSTSTSPFGRDSETPQPDIGRDSVGPEHAAGRDSAGPDQAVEENSARPEQAAGQDSAGPEQAAGRDSTGPEQAAGRDLAGPEQAAGRDSTGPEQAAGRDLAGPEQAAGRDWAGPEQAAGQDSSGPDQAVEQDSARPEQAAEQDSAGPEQAAEQDSAGPEQTEQNELEESLTDVSVVDSHSDEARSAVLTALAETLHSSLSEGPDPRTTPPLAPPPDKQAAETAAVPTVDEQVAPAEAALMRPLRSSPAVDAETQCGVQVSAGRNTAQAPVPAGQPVSVDGTVTDLDALLGGLDVTRLEEKFEGVCATQLPPVASSLVAAVEHTATVEETIATETEVAAGNKMEIIERVPVESDTVAVCRELVSRASLVVTPAAPDPPLTSSRAPEAAPEPAAADNTVSALPISRAVVLDVSRLIEENRTLLSQIRRRRSSGEPASPGRRTAGSPEPPPTWLAADSLESPTGATELDLSDWAHESEVASVAEVLHQFRVDERFVTVRRGAALAGERANLATLSDFEDDVSELPEDPVSTSSLAPPKEASAQFDDLDFADNSASGENENSEPAPPPSARNLGRCEYVFPEVAASRISSSPVAKVTKGASSIAELARTDAEPTEGIVATTAADTDSVTAAVAESRPVTPYSLQSVTSSLASDKSITILAVASKSSVRPVQNKSGVAASRPSERRQSAVEVSAEGKVKYVRSSGYGKITAPNRTAGGSSTGIGSSLSQKPSIGKMPSASNAQKMAKERDVSGKAASSRGGPPTPRGDGDRTLAPPAALTARESASGRQPGSDRATRSVSAGPRLTVAAPVRSAAGASAASTVRTSVSVPAPKPVSATASKAATKSVPLSVSSPIPPTASTAVRSQTPRTSAPPINTGIRVSPVVEQASARLLLQRSPTDSVIILNQQPAATARPLAPRAQQGILVRDLVLSRVKSPERQLRKRLAPAFSPRTRPPPLPPTAPPPATAATAHRPCTGGQLSSGPPPPPPPGHPAAALSLFTPTAAPAVAGALRVTLSRSTPSMLEGVDGPADAASPELSSSPERGGPEGRSEPATPPRRRPSIIRAISDIFKSGEKKDSACSGVADRMSSTSPPAGWRDADSPTRPHFVKANSVRDKLAVKFRKAKERRSEEAVDSPGCSEQLVPVQLSVTHNPDASLSDCLGGWQSSEAGSHSGAPSRRTKTSRAARHADLRRLQRAQELQRQLDELEVRQRELEQRGITVEKAIRGEGHAAAGADEPELMQEWFELVHERALLVRRDQVLQLHLRELELEQRHDRLQLELRHRMATSDAQKSCEDVERERQVVSALLELSDQRRSLRATIDSEQKRLTSECESPEVRRASAAGPAESTV